MSLEGKSVEDIQALAELAEALNTDPRTRATFLRGVKTINPNANIPEVDIPAGLAAQFAEPLQRLEALTKKDQEREIRDRINERRAEIRKLGVTEDEIPKIEKLMVDKSIASHATAVEYMRNSERAAAPTGAAAQQGIRRLEKPQVDLKAMGGDMKGWAYQQAHQAIDELRGRSAAR
jgi:hypothetical protein